MAVTQDGDISTPPPPEVPFEDPAWAEWFNQIFESVGRRGTQSSQLAVRGKERNANFTAQDIFQELLTLDCGLYSNYSSGNGNPIYGFASNVRRSAGKNAVTGGQFNGWGNSGLSSSVIVAGVGAGAFGEERFLGSLFGVLAGITNRTHNNVNTKVGMSVSFQDRPGAAVTSLGSNQYNYYSHGIRFTSQARSSVGEFCGWSVGVQFLSDCLDESTPRAWSATDTYGPGEVVTSGGLAWKAIQSSLNQAPAVPSAFWVQHTVAGTQVLAIGIDFSCLSTQTMARMAAAIRLRDTMAFQWDVTGAIGSFYNPAAAPNPRLVICDQAGTERIGIDVTNGDIYKNGVFLI